MITIGSFLVSIVSFKFYERKKRLMMSKEEKFFSAKKSANFHPDNMSPILIIPHNQLKLTNELGSGAFGKVFLGYWKTKDPNSKNNEEIRRKYIFSLLNPLI